MSEDDASGYESKLLLHLAFGGVFTSYDAAEAARRANAQATVDSAETRCFIVHRRCLLEPHAVQPGPAAAPRKTARKS